MCRWSPAASRASLPPGLAHYDYWSDTVRRSILLDCKADLVAYGMGEETIVEIAQRLAAGGETVRDLRTTCAWRRHLRFGREEAASMASRDAASEAVRAKTGLALRVAANGNDAIILPTYEAVKADKPTFAEATRASFTSTRILTTPRRSCSSTTVKP